MHGAFGNLSCLLSCRERSLNGGSAGCGTPEHITPLRLLIPLDCCCEHISQLSLRKHSSKFSRKVFWLADLGKIARVDSHLHWLRVELAPQNQVSWW
jgi:hypothetical protein|eukprot:COSAG02_NODE_66_length_42609_cov_95.996848_12_plen_97_part_00